MTPRRRSDFLRRSLKLSALDAPFADFTDFEAFAGFGLAFDFLGMRDYTNSTGGLKSRSAALRAALLTAALAAMLAFFYVYEVPRVTRLTNEVQNAGHVPFFGVLSLIALALSRLVLPRLLREGRPAHPLWHYGIAFLVSMAVGVVLEISQIGTARNADPADLARNLAGTLVFLGLRLSADPEIMELLPGRNYLTVTRLRAICAVLFLFCLAPIGLETWVRIARNEAYPAVADFNKRWSWYLLETHGASVRRSNPPPDWREAQGRKVLKLRTRTSSHYPRIKLDEPYPDWSGHNSLSLCIYSVESEPFPIDIKIHDYERREEYSDRFTREFTIQPGLNKLRLPLEEVRKGPEGREMNMRDIESITLLLDHPKVRRTFYLDSFYLDK